MADIFGLPVEDLPEGAIPLRGIVMVVFLDEDGDEAYAIRATDDMRGMETVGLLTMELDRAKIGVRSWFITEENS